MTKTIKEPRVYSGLEYVTKVLGKKVLRGLGAGAYGECFLLTDGRVLKITSCENEYRVAQHIFLGRFPKSEYLPILNTVGRVPDTFEVILDIDIPDDDEDDKKARGWYIREEIQDCKISYREEIDIIDELEDEFFARLDIEIEDLKVDNFGFRNGTKQPVIRDLGCFFTWAEEYLYN